MILYAVPENGQVNIPGFLAGLEPKAKVKIHHQLVHLAQNPTIGEPHVKHFTIEKYKQLYELRTKSKIVIRIIFTFTDKGDILLLAPFFKRQKRDTMKALDTSLSLLAQIDAGTCTKEKLIIKHFQEETK